MRIVMTNGCFDILHAGHVEFLRQAAAFGDFLVVAVNDNASVRSLKGDGRPVNHLEDRLAVLRGLRWVDMVVPFGDETPVKLIDAIRPDVLVKGEDYTVDEIAGADIVQSYGGKVELVPLVSGRSTTGTIARLAGGNHA